jgi:hypothetical protein
MDVTPVNRCFWQGSLALTFKQHQSILSLPPLKIGFEPIA